MDKHQTSTITTTRTAIDTSGYFIDLPSTHHIETQHGNDFNVYYFTPNDTLKNPGEAGFYIGPRPDANPPSSKYSVLEMDGEILGENHKWMEYTTQYYTQRETFIDLGNGSFIHAWCYSDDHDELERLFKMISTIGK